MPIPKGSIILLLRLQSKFKIHTTAVCGLGQFKFWGDLFILAMCVIIPSDLLIISEVFMTKRLRVVGMPFAHWSDSFNRGVEHAPQKIKEMLDMLLAHNVEYLSRAGDSVRLVWEHEPVAESQGTLQKWLKEYARQSWQGQEIPLFIGGDHGISFFTIEPFARLVGRDNLAVISLDAHPDAKLTSEKLHARWLACLIRGGIIDPKKVLLMGCRNVEPEEAVFIEKNLAKKPYDHYFPMKELGEKFAISPFYIRGELDGIMAGWRGKYLYVTIDSDVADPSEMPGTSYKAPGGLTFRELIGLVSMISEIAKKHEIKVVGVDLTEVNPVEEWKITGPFVRDLITELAVNFGKEV